MILIISSIWFGYINITNQKEITSIFICIFTNVEYKHCPFFADLITGSFPVKALLEG